MKKQPRRTAQAKTFVGTLVRMLESTDLDEAQRAVQALGEAADPSAIKSLVNIFKRSSALRAATMAALKKISKKNDAAATELAIALLTEKREQPGQELSARDTPQADRRRMPRVLLKIPVVVTWTDKNGQSHTEPSTTELVNAYGALVRLTNPVALGLELEITNVRTQANTKARVVWVGSRSPEGGVSVGIELDDPDPAFWVGCQSQE